ncbi:Major facilitator super domain-containing protein 8 [Bulinus truncatus]|nr:Major facilitator super domain-containing protein 8 [Bulinus truncatus]
MSSSSNDEEEIRTPLLGSRVVNDGAVYRPESVVGIPSTVVEPPNFYRSRWRSIRVMYLTMFLGSVTFTITMSSLWPFLQVLNPSSTASFLGWVVSAYSLGQLAASPFFGGWSNFRNSSREPLTVSLLLTTLSNVFYMYLQSFPSHEDYYMILARGLIGFSAGNVAVVRSYISGATTVKERTSTMANLSIFQAMGFILGPVIQAILVPVGFPGPIESTGFHFNMYTAPAFFAVVVAIINLLLLIFVFKEHRVNNDDLTSDIQSSEANDNDSNNSVELTNSTQNFNYTPDYVAVISTIFLFFVVLFMFTVFETIGTPLTMHMYAWTKSKATLYQGITLGVAGLLSIIVFIVTKIAVKRFSERYLLLFGFSCCLGGFFVFIPWGHVLPPQGLAPVNPQNSSETYVGMYAFVNVLLANHNPTTNLVAQRHLIGPGSGNDVTITMSPLGNTTTVYSPEGCPWDYNWCTTVPMIHIAQYFGATALISIGYPMCNLLSYTIYSKVLGPKPQGLWMGWLTASGSLARTVGPIYVSQVYDSYGPQITFGSCCGFIVATICFYLIVFKRLVPFEFKDASLPRFGGSEQKRYTYTDDKKYSSCVSFTYLLTINGIIEKLQNGLFPIMILLLFYSKLILQ